MSRSLLAILAFLVGTGVGFGLGRIPTESLPAPAAHLPAADDAPLELREGPALVGTRKEPAAQEPEVVPAPSIGRRTVEVFEPDEVVLSRLVRRAAKPDNRPRIQLEAGTRHGDVTIPDGHVLELAEGQFHIAGDIEVGQGSAVHAPKATVVLDGQHQDVRGRFTVGRLRLSGGRVRVAQGATLATRRKDREPGVPELVVARGTVLLIEAGATVNASSDYGYQIAGEVRIEGGTFVSGYANGDGEKSADSWLPGSRLVLLSGTFQGGGDHDFRDATILIEGGHLKVDDDLWNLGEDFRMEGGRISNARYGGAFGITGRVDIRGGVMRINQRGARGLFVGEDASFYASAGRIEIAGGDARGKGSGMLLKNDVVVRDLHVAASTRIREDSLENATLDVRGNLTIAPGKTLDANGRIIEAVYNEDPKQGRLVR